MHVGWLQQLSLLQSRVPVVLLLLRQVKLHVTAWS